MMKESLMLEKRAGKGDFVLVNLTGKRTISHYIAKVVNYFHGHEYEVMH